MKKSNRTGRTVREIIELNPEQISEVWCRKVFRQLLRLLEKQYAQQLPHRVITPDTVVVHDDGSMLLLPSLHGDPEPGVAADLTALARVVHYAITGEVVPTGPLRGRAPEGFSASLVSAVDRCLAYDPARRPRTVDELRDLLGIVRIRPASAAGRPAPAVPPRKRHRAWAVAGLAILMSGVGLAVFAGLRSAPPRPVLANGAGTPAADERTANGAAETAAAAVQAESGGAASAAEAVVEAAEAATQSTAPQAASKTRGAASRPNAATAAMPAAPPPPMAIPAPAAANPVADTGAVFTLHIQPWGRVVVDGVERGISPPVKQLVLAPGRHAVLVINPGAGARVLEVDTARGDGRIAVDFENGQR